MKSSFASLSGRTLRRACALGAGGLIVLCSSLALADESSTYKETQSGQDQNITFKDDPLAAGGFGPHDVILHVPPTPKRVTLLRPRTQFIPELLKTVESL